MGQRLIDADEAIINFGFEWDDISPTRDEFVAFLKKQPTIDAVPVVRCYECKHWKKDVAGCTEFVGRCAYANYMIGANGYCLYGEREENG